MGTGPFRPPFKSQWFLLNLPPAPFGITGHSNRLFCLILPTRHTKALYPPQHRHLDESVRPLLYNWPQLVLWPPPKCPEPTNHIPASHLAGRAPRLRTGLRTSPRSCTTLSTWSSQRYDIPQALSVAP